jgi:serine/threonine protein kinase
MMRMGDGSPLAHSPTLAATPPRDDGDRFAAGAKVGEYVIDRFIGAGAMGEVYAGVHPVIGKRVAIKVLRVDLAASAEAAERFIREARAVNQIDHENVVDVFAFGRLDDGRLYLVMDLVEGKSLRAALVNGPLEIELALMILDKIADALDAAHARGVVHRDLKPDNIVLSSSTPPKVFVLDFGIAKLFSTANADEKTGPGTLTGQGTWLGTPGYMAPEQWSVDGAGPASDRYALGVIAFELLSGALPFSAPSVPGMMEQHFRADVPALSARGGVGIPAAVDAVVKRALAKEPEARFPTARAFVDALRAAVRPRRRAHRGSS